MGVKENITTVFVDCFDTIIFRKVSTKEVFKEWAKEVSNIYDLSWENVYKTFKQINFNACLKKIFTTFTLQENYDIVIDLTYHKLLKTYPSLKEDFIKTAKDIYINTELKNFLINDDMVDFIRNEKNTGKKIYMVSDFYCKSDILKHWLTELNIVDIFEDVFSSADFNKEKATAKLYKHLVKQLGLNPATIIMYGDNIWSDVMMAKLCDLNAKHIEDKGDNDAE